MRLKNQGRKMNSSLGGYLLDRTYSLLVHKGGVTCVRTSYDDYEPTNGF